ncbi:prostatic acid phosphatase-like isoform X1 [Lycorma delicatula]|uniref:prostatic acid phosphatase-like isoform X1 n=1 Tax=Lycorma delicatula TaxID=130591 RepID=UPI003F51A9C3
MWMIVNRICTFIILVILMTVNAADEESFNETSLKFVAILHRHGQRTPLEFYEFDPYKDVNKYWPIGLGQLTARGKLQLYELGKTFKERYKSFISNYSAKSVRVSSSDADRCHMSVAALLAGLFPPQGDEVWNKELLWQPIPIHSEPSNEDKILGLTAYCPRYIQERNKAIKEIADNETVSEKALYKYFSENLGEIVEKFVDIEYLYHTLSIEEQHGLTLPPWTKMVHPHKTKEKTALHQASLAWNKILKRFRGGPVLKEILGQFKEKSEGHNEDKKLLLYSAHDTTIVSVLRALEFNNLLVPDFGASLIFELQQLNDEYFVKIFYLENASQTQPNELQIPDCLTPCPLDTLLNITEYVRSVDWDEQCKIV